MEVLTIFEKKDRQNGIIVAISSIALAFLIFFVFKIDILDPPPKEIPAVATLDLEEIEIKEFEVAPAGGGSGGGTPSDDPVVQKPQPQVQEYVTSEKTKSKVTVNTGKSNKTNDVKGDNEPSTTESSPNPFGTGGSGGGKGSGKGKGFGNDEGEDGDGKGKGKGSGPGDGAGRVRLNDPNNDNIYSEVPHTIKLKLIVDAQGNVVDGESLVGTTTTDRKIINQVISNCKKQVKYSKKAGAGLEYVFVTVNIYAR